MAKRATAVLAGPGPLLRCDLVVAECVYVLASFYEVERLDYAEAYLVFLAEATGVGEVVSFDHSIHRVATVARREP